MTKDTSQPAASPRTSIGMVLMKERVKAPEEFLEAYTSQILSFAIQDSSIIKIRGVSTKHGNGFDRPSRGF